MKKSKNAIFIADTRPFLLGHLLLQIKETNSDLFQTAIVYHQNMSESDQEVLGKIMDCKFVNYNPSELPDQLFVTNYHFSRFTKFMFARYEMFNYLDEYDNILWIDTDVLIQGSLSELIESAEQTGMAMLREDPVNKSYKRTDINRTNFTQTIDGYDMNAYLYCSGLIVVNKKIKQREKLTEWLYDKTIELADYLILPDQGILNLMIQEFEIDVVPIGNKGKYGVFPYLDRDCEDAIVVHSWGKNKFWNSWYLYNRFPKWRVYYDQWVKLGGSLYNKEFKPDISILIPVYKPKMSLFKLQLDSLRNQMLTDTENYTNFEIIIVAEPTELKELDELVEQYNDPRIRIIKNSKRMGIAASLNIGMKEATAKYIARVDDDDICAPYRLIKQFNYLETHPKVHLCTSNYEYFGDMNEGRYTLSKEMSHAWSLLTCPFDHPTIMFRKNFFIDNELFYDESRSHVEDWELWLRAFDKGMVVGNIPEILYYHRWYNGQAGQDNKTVIMMRELVRSNFKKLNIDLSEGDLLIVAPWQGMINPSLMKRLTSIFSLALKNNELLKIYDQKSLEQVFNYRLEEAKSGKLSSLTLQSNNNNGGNSNLPLKKRVRRKLLSPLYKPFKRVMYNIVQEAVNDNLKSLDYFLSISNIYKDDQRRNELMELIDNKLEIVSYESNCISYQLDIINEKLDQIIKDSNNSVKINKSSKAKK